MTLTPQSNSIDIYYTTFLYDCVRRGMWPFVPDMVDY